MTSDESVSLYRERLMQTAQNLTIQLKEVSKQINAVTAALQSEADMLLMEAAAEQTGGKTVRKISFSKKDGIDSLPAPSVSPRGQRKCGLCGEVGHNARTCTSKIAQNKDTRRGL